MSIKWTCNRQSKALYSLCNPTRTGATFSFILNGNVLAPPDKSQALCCTDIKVRWSCRLLRASVRYTKQERVISQNSKAGINQRSPVKATYLCADGREGEGEKGGDEGTHLAVCEAMDGGWWVVRWAGGHDMHAWRR